MLRFCKRQLEVFRQLPGEVISADRHTSLPNSKSVGDDQVARIGSNAKQNSVFLRRIRIVLLICHPLGKAFVRDQIVKTHRRKLHQIDIDPLVPIRLKSSENRILLHRKQANFALKRVAVFDLGSFHLLEIPNNVVQIKGNLLLRFVPNDVADFLDFHRRRLEELR